MAAPTQRSPAGESPAPATDPGPGPGSTRAASVAPGLVLAVALGALGFLISHLAGTRLLGWEKSPISPVIVGIVLGMTIRHFVPLPGRVHPGLRFAGNRILRLGIILLGIRLSVFEIMRVGTLGLPVVIACILFGVLFTSWLARRFSLPPRLGTLVGVGTSICGVSAIAATGPVIGASDEETTYAIAVITVFGMLAMIAYPFLCPLLFNGDPTSIGLFLGTAVHDTSQVNGAGIIYSDAHDAPLALNVAVVTKLVRNLFMIAVIPLMAWRHHRAHPNEDDRSSRVPVLRLFPLFVIGFVIVAALRSIGDAGLVSGAAFSQWDEVAWAGICGAVQRVSMVCLVVALSAVGLSTDFRAMKSLSLRPFLLGLGAALAVGAVSFGVIRVLSPA